MDVLLHFILCLHILSITERQHSLHHNYNQANYFSTLNFCGFRDCKSTPTQNALQKDLFSLLYTVS